MYEVENLCVGYGKKIVIENLSVKFDDNQVIGILGPNGSGKTTLMETLEGIKEKKSGKITFDKHEVDKYFKNKVGIQFQSASFYRKLKVEEVFDYFAKFFNSRINLKDLMGRFDLLSSKNKYIEHLSDGMKQKVAVSVALLNDRATIVFLDEPTAGMDIFSRKRLWKIIRDLKKERKTVVLATHYIEEAEALCDSIAILSKGKLVDYGNTDYLINKYCHNYHIDIEIVNTFDVEDLMKRFDFIKNIKKKDDLLFDFTIDSHTSYQHYFKEVLSYFTEKGNYVNYFSLKQANLEEAFVNICGYKLDENGDLIE